MKKFFLAALIGTTIHTSEAFAECPEPSAPICISSDETYKDKEAYETCRGEVTAYHESVKQYISCMQEEAKKTADEIQKKINDIGDKTNKLIKDFNCNSGITDDC